MRAIFLLALLSGCACFHRAPPPPTPTYAPPPAPSQAPVTQRRGG